MSNKAWEFEFMARLGKEFPDMKSETIVAGASHLIRLGRRHRVVAETYCNVYPFPDQMRIEYGYDPANPDEPIMPGEPLWPKTIEAKLEKVNEEYFDGKLSFVFQGDPRGVTVRVIVPSGQSDHSEGGLCIPGA